MTQNKIIFAFGSGSLRDARKQKIPNFDRPSPCLLMTEVSGSVRLTPVAAHEPAIFDDGSVLLEPESTNLMTWNMDLTKSVWQRGSNVFVRSDRGTAPDGSFLSDLVAWVSGFGSSQKFQRQFSLKPARDYCLALILQPTGGRCGANDVIRITGDVVGSPSMQLASLNDYIGKDRFIFIPFRTSGKEAKFSSGNITSVGFSITAVTDKTVTISDINDLEIDGLKDIKINFGDSNSYTISGNTASVNGIATITIESGNLINNGVTTSKKATLEPPSSNQCTIEIYCESTFSLLWGGSMLTERSFPTSPIYQASELNIQARSSLYFQPQDNPLVDIGNFGIFGELTSWYGDGNLADFGDIKIDILNGKLKVVAGFTTLVDQDAFPRSSRFFIGVSVESSSISLFVDGVLKQQAVLANFRPTAKPIILTSDGVRVWKNLICYGQTLLDGKPSIGGYAGQEVATLFDVTQSVIGPDLISSPTKSLVLPLVTVPGIKTPEFKAQVLSIDPVNKYVLVESNVGLALNDTLEVVRGEPGSSKIITAFNAIGFYDTTYILVDSLTGMKVGDYLVKGEVDSPGRTFIRLPFIPIDEREILSVDTSGNRVRVDTSLSFVKNNPAIIRRNNYQDVTEVSVRDADFTTGWLVLDDVSDIKVGHLISQARSDSQTLINPSNYVVRLTNPLSSVRVHHKAQNGITFENTSPDELVITPLIEVYL